MVVLARPALLTTAKIAKPILIGAISVRMATMLKLKAITEIAIASVSMTSLPILLPGNV